MRSESFVVRAVNGRYPHWVVLRPENIESSVTAEGGLVTVRLDDRSAPDFWLEIVLVVQQASGE